MQDAQSLIEVKRAILHILDLNSGVPVFSDEELDREIFEFLQKHLEKAWKDAAAHTSAIGEINPVRVKLQAYQGDAALFAEVSQEFGQKLHQDLLLCGEERAVDLVAVDFLAAGVRQFGLLVYQNQLGYTHKVAHSGNQVRNEIIQHYAILPNPTQKVSMFAFVDMENWTVKFADKKRILDGEETFLLPDRLLNCTMPVSPKDTIKKVHTIVNKVAEEYGQNAAQAVSRAKAYLMEASETETEIQPEKVGRQVFATHPGMQQSYLEQVALASLPKATPVERDYAVRTNKSHKIKTDTGIEITVPSDFFNNPDYIEFVSNDNGTISINIKNVGKIINR